MHWEYEDGYTRRRLFDQAERQRLKSVYSKWNTKELIEWAIDTDENYEMACEDLKYYENIWKELINTSSSYSDKDFWLTIPEFLDLYKTKKNVNELKCVYIGAIPGYKTALSDDKRHSKIIKDAKKKGVIR